MSSSSPAPSPTPTASSLHRKPSAASSSAHPSPTKLKLPLLPAIDGAPMALPPLLPAHATDEDLSRSPLFVPAPGTSPPAPPPPPAPTRPTPRIEIPLAQYPQLSNNPPSSPDSKQPFAAEDKDEEPSVPKSFDRTAVAKPDAETKEERDAGLASTRMHRFTLYETAARYYIVGSDLLDSQFRILKIDRTAEQGDLCIHEDEVSYSRSEMMRLLATIEDGNPNGGLKQRCPFWGLLGFIRFTAAYYMLLITKRSSVALIGGRYIYQIDSTELVPLTAEAASRKPDRNTEEARFVSILGNLDLTRGFYFSYSYDITRTLQHNIIREREALGKGLAHFEGQDYNDMFAWNHYLLEPAKDSITNIFDWCMPIVHGYVDQAAISVYGRIIYITIIARRSRYFAGARFLKRGANDLGYVANDVETEQIVSEMLTTSFHAPGKRLYSNPNYTSYVQHRGSIPLFWTQKNDAATPKPPVEINVVDPFYSAAALHFDDLFARYGVPVIVLNLVKSRERTPRESLLLQEFTNAIKYLNQFLPKDSKIIYYPWDMSRAAKSRTENVIETLEKIGERVLNTTGFFHNGYTDASGGHPPKLQNGVCRTNCIDCLDRTNAAQFVIGKRALGHQLHSLGVLPDTTIDYDTDAVDLFTHMFHDHGDTIAVQYAGSHLVNTMETYRKINQWSSHSRDMLESFKRYYNNSFLDAQRQEAYNLFLGNYIFAQGQPMLWDLSTDYYLHHADPRAARRRRSYTKWWTPANLRPRSLPATSTIPLGELANKPYTFFDGYWLEYYRPRTLSTMQRLFTYNLKSNLLYIPSKMAATGTYDLSPFVMRQQGDQPPANVERRRIRKPISFDSRGQSQEEETEAQRQRLGAWLPPVRILASDAPMRPSLTDVISDINMALPSGSLVTSPSRTSFHAPPQHHPSHPSLQPSLTSLAGGGPVTGGEAPLPQEQRNLLTAVERSLHPSISDKEAEEYKLYMLHPLNLPLVTSTEVPRGLGVEFVEYVEAGRPERVDALAVREDDLVLYDATVLGGARENVLEVKEEDLGRKRYKAYGQWVITGRLKMAGGRDGAVITV